MTVIVLTDCPPRLRGDLTKWLMEINTGVYVGNLNQRIRDALWDRICEHVKGGRATMVYRAGNEQHMQFRVHNTTWEPVDFDGLTLMRRPLPHHREQIEALSGALKPGYSKAAHQQKARQMTKRKIPVTTYAVIDIETSGLKPMSDDIIEIAVLRVIDSEPQQEFSRLVFLRHSLTPDIIRLTGITDADLQEKGRPLEEVLDELQSFIGNLPLVSRNATFDQQFLAAACHKVGYSAMRNRFVDTLSIARRKLIGVPNYKLATLAAHLGIKVQHAHRALADCYTTHHLFSKLNKS